MGASWIQHYPIPPDSIILHKIDLKHVTNKRFNFLISWLKIYLYFIVIHHMDHSHFISLPYHFILTLAKWS